ncbi:MAG TPA: hypothetical protein GX497_06910 [Bacillus bacterium]|nr:hypothetical protein [Bacillus sp. (in: firmicutes)]
MNQILTNKKLIMIVVGFFIMISLFLFVKAETNNALQADFGTLGAKSGELGMPEELSSDEQTASEESEPAILYIDIKGAVLKPGVYLLEENSRVQDAIQLAGGFLETADQTKINLAARLVDEMVLYVPVIGEETTIEAGGPSFNQTDDGKVNINSATSEQLQSLPGIGPAKAEQIISYREANGPFKKVDDLGNVSGIGEKTLEKLKELVKIR